MFHTEVKRSDKEFETNFGKNDIVRFDINKHKLLIQTDIISMDFRDTEVYLFFI